MYKVLDRKWIREKPCGRCQGLLAPQLPAPLWPQLVPGQPWGALCWGKRYFADSFANSLQLRGNVLAVLGALSLGCFEMLEVQGISSVPLLQPLTHSFWGACVVRNSLSNVASPARAQVVSTPASRNPAGSRGLLKTRSMANKFYI